MRHKGEISCTPAYNVHIAKALANKIVWWETVRIISRFTLRYKAKFYFGYINIVIFNQDS